MTTISDILIIGGGIVGLMSAREFARAGLSVTLLERNRIGQECSWAGGGILSPLYPWRQPEAVNALCSWSQANYAELAISLHESTGIDPEWLASGLMIGDCADYQTAANWCVAQSLEFKPLSNAELEKLEPRVKVANEKLLYLPEVAQIRNPRLIKALKADLEKLGVEILEYHPVISLEKRAESLLAVRTTQAEFSAARYIVATGAWSGTTALNLPPQVAVKPVKGEMIMFKAAANLLETIILSHDRYLIPRQDGRILAGSTVEDCGFDNQTTPEARRLLYAFAVSILPALADYPIEGHWSGLRPGSHAGIPFIDKHPGFENLYYNCGHFRNGIVMAPASARLLADLALGRTTNVPAAAYALDAMRQTGEITPLLLS